MATPDLNLMMPNVLERARSHSPQVRAILRDTTYRIEGSRVEIEVASRALVAVAERNRASEVIAQLILEETSQDALVVFVQRAKAASPAVNDNLPVEETVKAPPRPPLAEARKTAGAVDLSGYVEGYFDMWLKQNGAADMKKMTDKGAGPAIEGSTVKGKGISSQAPLRQIKTVTEEENNVVIEGEMFNLDSRDTRTGKQIISFVVCDLLRQTAPGDMGDSLVVKIIRDPQKEPDYLTVLKNGAWVKIRGNVSYDKFSNELTMIAHDLNLGARPSRSDSYAGEKRVELHAHTTMSENDGLINAEELVKRAVKWGHKAVAVMDHAVVQGYTIATHVKVPDDFKILFGCEFNVVDDSQVIIERAPQGVLMSDADFVVLDIETTGFSPIGDDITELGAVRYKNGEMGETFQRFVRPSKPIPQEVVKLTNITNDMVADAPTPEIALREFFDFIGDAIIVAHNAQFDYGFLRYHRRKHLGEEFDNPVLDTLILGRSVIPHMKSHSLAALTKELGVQLVDHHRADADAKATAVVMAKLFERGKKVNYVHEINELTATMNVEQLRPYLVSAMVQKQHGIKNMYRLISLSHTEHLFKGKPRMPRTLLDQHRDGLMLGSGTEGGALYEALLKGVPEDELRTLADWYDYLEILPRDNLHYLLKDGQVNSLEQLLDLNRKIYALGQQLGKPVVAVGDAHFMDPHEQVFRKILKASQGGFRNGEHDAALYFRTTQEMLDDFAYLGQDAAMAVVVENPLKLVAMIDKVQPVPNKLYPPVLEGTNEQTRELSYSKTKRVYGDPIPEKILARLDRELNAIIGNGFAVSYYISHLLIKKSMDMGYLVGSRGSVGSSFVAWAMDISEVNPLPPHYVCPDCKHIEWHDDGNTGSGYDLADKACPNCGHAKMIGEGHDIPFETFLGFKGDKVPDIDLNFSGDVQNKIQKFSEELLGGDKYVFKAGTVGTIADKTGYGMAKGWLEDNNIIGTRDAHVSFLASGVVGVKRTSGQHPGGMVVCPVGMDIEEVTPVQYPANDPSSGQKTTHFDYHSFEQALMKLDILGHDDPTMLKTLQDMYRAKYDKPTFDVRNLPMNDAKVLRLFSPGGQEALSLKDHDLQFPLGTIALPEMGTRFVRQMLMETHPKTFSDLVRISGLSHGTDVWTKNAQDLIKKGTCTLQNVIPTRDDIMVRLMYWGIEPAIAFKIMESVRKGKGLAPEMEDLMNEKGVPDWYIWSCKQIKYMFPKAHAAAYVLSCIRIAWFKVYEPEMYYAAYFSIRAAGAVDANLLLAGPEAVRAHITGIEAMGREASNKDKDSLTEYELVEEAFKRGTRFAKVDLYNSHATHFQVLPDGKLLCPFNALPGIADAAAQGIVDARRDVAEFMSQHELKTKARLNKNAIEVLQSHGCLKGLPETNQLTFDFGF